MDPSDQPQPTMPLAGPIQRLSLLVANRDWDHATDAEEAALCQLAASTLRQQAAVDLRLARLLAFLHASDLSLLGYSSWGAFVRERVDLRASWVRDLVRLVNSPLELVKQAVNEGVITLSVAVLAPGHVAVDQQQDWLVRAISGQVQDRPTRRRFAQGPAVLADKAASQVIQAARKLARLLMGWRAPLPTVDEFILSSWRDRLPARLLLAQAREDPPRPARLDAQPSWPGAPHTDLLGPWVQPANLADAARQLDALQDFRRGRLLLVGQAIHRLVTTGAYLRLGYDTVADFAVGAFGVSLRTLRRYARLGRDTDLHPELDTAIRDGLPLAKARLIAGIVDAHSVDWWVALARRLGRAELERATAWARSSSTDRAVREAYDTASAQVLAQPDASVTANGAPRIALRGGSTPTPPAPSLWVHPDLPKAAAWLLSSVQIPRAQGYRKTREDDDHICQTPECRRRSLRCQVHHIIPRAQGGTDEPDLLVTLCPSCHLRLVHTGRLSVRRQGDLLCWTWQAGRQVWMHSPVVANSSAPAPGSRPLRPRTPTPAHTPPAAPPPGSSAPGSPRARHPGPP